MGIFLLRKILDCFFNTVSALYLLIFYLKKEIWPVDKNTHMDKGGNSDKAFFYFYIKLKTVVAIQLFWLSVKGVAHRDI